MVTVTTETIGAAGRNLARYSEDFTAGYWSTSGTGTVNTNVAVAPSGAMVADRLDDNDPAAKFYVYHDFPNSLLTNGVDYTGSVYMKMDTSNYARIALRIPGGSRYTEARVDLATGKITTTSTGGGGVHLSHAGYCELDFGDDGALWWRSQVVVTYDSTGSLGLRLELYPADGSASAQNETFFWGAQLEQRTYASPYQPQTDGSGNDLYAGTYATVQAWISAHDGENLVSSDVRYEGRLLDDVYELPAGGLTIGTCTTDSTRYRFLRPDPSFQRYQPWNHTGPRLYYEWSQGSSDEEAIQLTENWVHLEGFAVICEDPAQSGLGTTAKKIGIHTKADNARLNAIEVEIQQSGDTAGALSSLSYWCFYNDDTSGFAEDNQFFNCIARGTPWRVGAGVGFYFSAFSKTGGCYNCIAHDITRGTNTYGFWSLQAIATAGECINCIAVNCHEGSGLDWAGIWARYGHILTSDGSALAGVTNGYNTDGDLSLADPDSIAYVGGSSIWTRPDVGDYRMRPGGPAVKAGYDVTTEFLAALGKSEDWDANSRSAVQFSIGPLELQQGPPSSALPTEVIEYVGPPPAHYPTLIEAALATQNKHLVDANEVRRLQLTDTTEVDYASSPIQFLRTVCSSSRYRIVEPAAGNRHDPIEGTGARIKGQTSASTSIQYRAILDIREAHFRAEGFGIANTTSASVFAVMVWARAPYVALDSLFLSWGATGTGTFQYGFDLRYASLGLVTNCAAIGAGTGTNGMTKGFVWSDAERLRILNCMAFECDGAHATDNFGFHEQARTTRCEVQNCNSFDSGDLDFKHDAGAPAAYVTQSHNISSDTSATGPGSKTSETAASTFNDSSNGDFRLISTSPAVRSGVNLIFRLSKDIDAVQRIAPFDIGVYSGVVSPPLMPKPTLQKGLWLATAWALYREDGVAFFFTDAAEPIQHGPHIYQPVGGFNASARRGEPGLADRSMQAVGAITSSEITATDLAAGLFRNARVCEQLIDPRFPFAEPVEVREYRISTTEHSDDVWSAEAVGLSEDLEQTTGEANMVGCAYPFGGVKCGVDIAPNVQDDVRVSSTIQDDRLKFNAESADISASYADDYFAKGKLYWLTGDNANRRSQVKEYTSSTRTIELEEETDYPISAGDTFIVEPGCRKRYLVDCIGKWSNGKRFGGEPFMPGTDKALQTPTQ